MGGGVWTEGSAKLEPVNFKQLLSSVADTDQLQNSCLNEVLKTIN